MKVTLIDGHIIKGTLSSLATGYRAKSIEIESHDVRQMLFLLDHDPAQLRAVLLQLANRWPMDANKLDPITGEPYDLRFPIGPYGD